MASSLTKAPSLNSIPSSWSLLSSQHSDDFSLFESEVPPLTDSPRPTPSHVVSGHRSRSTSPGVPRPADEGSPAIWTPCLRSHLHPTIPAPHEGPSAHELQGLLYSIQHRVDDLWHCQLATDRMLADMKERHQADHEEMQARLVRIDEMLDRALNHTSSRLDPSEGRVPRLADIGGAWLERLERQQDPRARSTQHTDGQASGQSFDGMIAEMLAIRPQISPLDVEHPPAVTRLICRPFVPSHLESPVLSDLSYIFDTD